MGVTVDTAAGRVEGLQREKHQSFLGIPFARPPVGALRFCAPQPAEPWAGVRAATQFAASAVQGTHPIPGMAASGPRDEDCLYLNVYTPAADAGRRPVLFWIHGGGFTMGSGSEALYDGGPLAVRGDVVVVTIHYRLGALGYLSLLGHGGDAWDATANAGQLDQIAALRWVSENVAAFGGDPARVTIFGESAGAAAVASLLAMPEARGLFGRAVCQSGSANRLGNVETAARTADAFLAAAGLSSGDVAALREIPAEKILEAQLGVQRGGGGGFGPIVDGVSLPERPLDALRDGAARDVDLVVGTNRDEVKLFNSMSRREPIDDAALAEQVAATLPRRARGRAEGLIATYRESRTGRLSTANLDLLDAIQTDARFRIPALRLAETQGVHQPNTYVYLFCHQSPARRGALGACHALEMPFVFGTLDAPTQDRFAGTGPGVERLSAEMMEAWIGFAKSGDPSPHKDARWEAYDMERRPTMIFGPGSQAVDAPFEEERAAWDEILN